MNSECIAGDPTFLFVNLSLGLRITGVNHGIAALVPVVRRYGYHVSVWHVERELSAHDFRRAVQATQPSIIGFSATSHQEKFLIRYSNAIRDLTSVLRIAGGPLPTLDPFGTLADSALHGVCVGEGEIPLAALLELLGTGQDPSGTPGFCWRTLNGIRQNPVPDFVEDLSTLDDPDYGVFHRDLVVRPWNAERSLVLERTDRKRSLEVMLGRGCPHRCSYCCNHAFRANYSSTARYFRLPPVARAIAMLEDLLALYPEAQHIEFLDDLLIANRRWFLEFSRVYAERIRLSYRICGRFEYLTEKVVQALRDSGCTRVLVGLESGNEQLRKRLLNRAYTNEQAVCACNRLKVAGIALGTLNMVGFPMETRRELGDTLELNRRIRPEFGTVFYFRPYQGTQLHRLCQEHGLLLPKHFMREITSNYVRPLVRFTHMTHAQCRRFRLRLVLFFFGQTVRYRLRSYWQRRSWPARMTLPWALARAGWLGVSVFLSDAARSMRSRSLAK